MKIHGNARASPQGRELPDSRIEVQGWSLGTQDPATQLSAERLQVIEALRGCG